MSDENDKPVPPEERGGVPAVQSPTELPAFPEPKVTVKSNVNMRFRQVDADGKVTQVDVDPKAAKRLLYGGIALLVISALLIFGATLFLLGRLFG